MWRSRLSFTLGLGLFFAAPKIRHDIFLDGEKGSEGMLPILPRLIALRHNCWLRYARQNPVGSIVSLIPEYALFLQQMEAADAPPISSVPLDIARAMFRNLHPVRTDLKVGAIKDVQVPVQAGSIKARVYVPPCSGPYPLIVFLHGGGWVIGDLDTADEQCRELCLGTNAAVLSVDYRLAPEHCFPVAAEDAYAGLLWAAENFQEMNLDRSRIAVAGDSAGGNLAAVVCMMSRDRGGPLLKFQLLVYPVTDGRSFDTVSYVENAVGYMLTAETMAWFWDKYVPDRRDRENPYASPLASRDLSNLPPALILTAEYDPLRDEGAAYCARLSDTGLSAELIQYDGFIHGFFSDTGRIAATRVAMTAACEAITNAFLL